MKAKHPTHPMLHLGARLKAGAGLNRLSTRWHCLRHVKSRRCVRGQAQSSRQCVRGQVPCHRVKLRQAAQLHVRSPTQPSLQVGIRHHDHLRHAGEEGAMCALPAVCRVKCHVSTSTNAMHPQLSLPPSPSPACLPQAPPPPRWAHPQTPGRSLLVTDVVALFGHRREPVPPAAESAAPGQAGRCPELACSGRPVEHPQKVSAGQAGRCPEQACSGPPANTRVPIRIPQPQPGQAFTRPAALARAGAGLPWSTPRNSHCTKAYPAA